MATKTDFTDAEWKALQKGVTGAGMLVSVSDRDFTDSFGEASALAKSLAAQHAQGASDLIREIADTHGTGFGMTASPQEVESETVAALGTAMSVLAAKAPNEVDNYTRLVMNVAEAVAEAKGGGVSEQEAAALDKVRAALGTS
jgi:hypothetical protein